MAGKRNLTPGSQNQHKKFKSAPGNKSPGKPNTKSIKKAPVSGSKGKRKNVNAMKKWKKKKVYVFKTSKKLIKTPIASGSVSVDGSKPTEGNLAVEKHLNKEKKKRKKRKKKRKGTNSAEASVTTTTTTDGGQKGVVQAGGLSTLTSENLKETVVKIGTKKKKRNKKKNKKRRVKGDVSQSPSTATTKVPDSSGKIGHSNETVVSKADKKSKGKKNTNRTDVKSRDVYPTAATNKEQNGPGEILAVSSSSSQKVIDQSVHVGKRKRPEQKSSGNTKKWQKEGKTKDSLLPRKPEEISANWKALLPKLDKPKVSKSQNVKQESNKRPSEVWFDDVDPELLKTNDLTSSSVKGGSSKKSSKSNTGLFVIDGAEEGPTKCVAMDCEMVGAGHAGRNSILARVSVVNQYGYCLYDKFVRPREDVTDYRTWVSGVRKKDLDNGEDFMTVQKEVADLLKGKILVGHALQNDMKVLFLDHPKRMVRDTYHYEPFREMFKSRRPGLKSLVEKILNVKVQQGEHNSVEDAQATMKLYVLHRKKWETSLKMKPSKKSST